MAVYTEEFSVSSSRRFELIDITDKVYEIVRRSGIKNGIVHVFVPHATAALIANEHESGLMNDYITLIKKLIPPEAPWEHNRIDDNAHAHLAAGIIGPSRSFPLINGRIVRGTWQNIFLVELDGPRSHRRVVVTVVGE
jgi:secondary thiamine-phosphate synthase enzyme